MQISHNISLKPYNTFGIDVKAHKFVSVSTEEELREVVRNSYAEELFVLGGGSNMLLTGDITKTVLHIGLTGKQIISSSEDEVIVKAMAGENWHQFVLWAIENDFGGLENLSLIPGNVGTAPIQNIGAYGVELKDVFESCEAINIQSLESRIFSTEDCEFGYRNSVFKNKLKGRYIITSVNFRLSKGNHKIQTGYGAIQAALETKGVKAPGIKDVSDAVISIRQQKLPDPRVLGNSGSFFKNPVISEEKFKDLQEKFPEIPSYPVAPGEVKVPAGWLIDQAGLKGYRQGDAGVHKNQALVLVNYGNASGSELRELAQYVQEKIKSRYGIELEAEVNIF